MNRIACIVPNFNMPERTNAITDYIFKNCQHNKPEIIVVDNGSMLEMPRPYAAVVSLKDNVQTTNGWLMGLHYADALARKYKGSFFGYWLIITSADFTAESKDPLAPMVEMMEKDYHTVGVSPALTEDSTTSWLHMKAQGHNGPRKTWMLDNICTLWRADWFNSIGRFDPALWYAWGVDLETSYKARTQGKSLWICEEVKVRKITDIGYAMDRMGMSAEKRKLFARANMDEVFTAKYGENWRALMYDAGEFDYGGKI